MMNNCTSNMNKIFNKKNSDQRKQWLGEYDAVKLLILSGQPK